MKTPANPIATIRACHNTFMRYAKNPHSFSGKAIWPAGIVLVILVMGLGDGPNDSEGPLDWTLGSWHGVRREVSTGDEAAMSLLVEKAPDGRGLIERLEVETDGDPYVGFAVSAPETSSDGWMRIYANDVRPSFARLASRSVTGDRTVWLSVTATPPKGSRLVSERLAPDRWRRTQQFSTDGGSTWKDLFVDELTRGAAAR
jgi:hypothetical protein